MNAVIEYDYYPIKLFTVAAVFWLIVALFTGVFIAFELVFPWLSGDLEWFSFGRMKPLHTSGIIFGFTVNTLFATSLYVVQRTGRTSLSYPSLAIWMFYGYQLFLVLAGVGYLFGFTQAREYAEPPWYCDWLLLIVWLLYIYLYFTTLQRRKEPHIYVANWFFMSFIIVVAILHIGNNISIPVSFTHWESVFVFSGVQSSMIQWWYGHNAVGFILTAGIIGMVYYFLPKRAQRPVYSYRLSILHFWAFIFLYM